LHEALRRDLTIPLTILVTSAVQKPLVFEATSLASREEETSLPANYQGVLLLLLELEIDPSTQRSQESLI
jgi:hypothetical protein